MGKFAFIIHPLDVSLVSIAFNESNLKFKKMSLLKKAFEWMPSFKCSEVTGLKSITDKEEAGYLIYCSLLPEQMISLDQKFVLQKVINGGKIAQELGAEILGLGAYAAQIGRKGVAVKKALSIPVTTGTHYTISVALESTLQAAKEAGIILKDAKASVIGATGGIGKICAQFLSEIVAELTLVARNKNALERFASSLKGNSKAQIRISDDLLNTIKDSDICIMSTTTPEPLIDIEDLTSGTVVCDISRPRNVSMKKGVFRDDVLVIDGGIVRPPGNVRFNFYFGLPEGLGYACMAETMILALEQRHEDYSLGGDVSLEKVKEIAALGKKHGFKLGELRSFDVIVPHQTLHKVKEGYCKRIKR